MRKLYLECMNIYYYEIYFFLFRCPICRKDVTCWTTSDIVQKYLFNVNQGGKLTESNILRHGENMSSVSSNRQNEDLSFAPKENNVTENTDLSVLKLDESNNSDLFRNQNMDISIAIPDTLDNSVDPTRTEPTCMHNDEK